MKKLISHLIPKDGALVAIFGQTRLIRTGLNRFEVRGGSTEDQAEAMEWMSMFLHGGALDQGEKKAFRQ